MLAAAAWFVPAETAEQRDDEVHVSREDALEPGVRLDAVWTLDFSRTGAAVGDAARALLDVGARFDMESLVGLRRTRLQLRLHALRGQNGSEAFGDSQGYSNVDAERFESLAELWVDHGGAGDRWRVRAGRIDANSTFAAVESATTFIHSSAGYSPTVVTMPTYPDARWGIDFVARPPGNGRFSVGIYESPLADDGVADRGGAWLLLGEVGVDWSRWGSGRFAVGHWRDGGTFQGWDGTLHDGGAGSWSFVEQRFDGRIPLALFAQRGIADRAVEEIARHAGVGAVIAGPLSGRWQDEVGVMWSRAGLTRAAGFLADETAIELFWSVELGRGVRLQPDLQWIEHAGGDPQRGTEFVATLRVEFSGGRSLSSVQSSASR